MGDPRKLRAKYSGPMQPWSMTRIEEERILKQDYGLKNKKEIWKISSKLKNYADQAKRLIAAQGKQAELEKTQLISKLNKFGLVKQNAQMDDVLSLNIKNLLDRRLQTVVFKKGYARTTKQARQYITHQHIMINNRLITSPSYLVTMAEEPQIAFKEKSSLNNPDHPERNIPKLTPAQEQEKKKKEEKRNSRQDRRQGNRQGNRRDNRRPRPGMPRHEQKDNRGKA
jgi:small subunit ribosomal protein S4